MAHGTATPVGKLFFISKQPFGTTCGTSRPIGETLSIDDIDNIQTHTTAASAPLSVRPLRVAALHAVEVPQRRRAPRRQTVEPVAVERRRADRRQSRSGLDGLLRLVLSDNWPPGGMRDIPGR